MKYFKKRQINYLGYIIIQSLKNPETRIIVKLLFTSNLSLSEIKSIKWKYITILQNIILLNYKNNTRIAIASESFINDILKLKHQGDYVFPNYKNLDIKTIKKKLNNLLYLTCIHLNICPIDCNWFQNNFKNTVYVPNDSKELFKKHIINRQHIINMKNKEFEKILEIKSLM